MKKLLLFLFVLSACFVQADNKLTYKPYRYNDKKSIVCTDTLGDTIHLRTGTIVFIKPDSVSGSFADILVSVDKIVGIPLHPKLKKDSTLKSFELVDSTFKEVFDTTFASVTDFESYQAKTKLNKFVAIVGLSGSKRLVLNLTDNSMDIYRNGKYVQELAVDGVILVDMADSAKVENFAFCSTTNIPTVANLNFGEVGETVAEQSVADSEQPTGLSKFNMILIGVGVALFLLCLVGVFFFIRHRKKSHKANADKPSDDNFRLAFENHNPLFDDLRKQCKKRRGLYDCYLMQTVLFPEDEEKRSCYVDSIVKRNYNDNQDIKAYIIKKLQKNSQNGKLELELPVEFYLEKSRRNKDNDAFLKVKLEGRTVWTRFIALYCNEDKVSSIQTDNKSDADRIKDQADMLSNLIPQLNDGETMPDTISIDTSSLVNVRDALSAICESVGVAYAAFDTKCANMLSDHNNTIETLNSKYNKDLKVAVDNKDDEWKAKTKDLKQERDNYKNTAQQLQEDLNKETKDKNDALKCIEDLKADIVRKEEESKEFNMRLVLYLQCADYAKTAVSVFDTVNEIENMATNLYRTYLDKGKDCDTFCYYMTRINRKFQSNTSKLEKLYTVYEPELRMLAAVGLVPKNGWIDKLLASQKDETKLVEQLRNKLYRDIFELYCGYAVIMADEYAYLLGKMVSDGVDKGVENKIISCVDRLKKNTRELGYKLIYARPFTMITEYDNVENEKFVDLGYKPNTIVEVNKMGVAYGTNKPKTTVTTQK